MLLYAHNKEGLNNSRLTSLKFICVGNPNHNGIFGRRNVQYVLVIGDTDGRECAEYLEGAW